MNPALSRGVVFVIGATSQYDSRNTFLKNVALALRFYVVIVIAPSAHDTFNILRVIRNRYVKQDNVVLPDTVTIAAVDFPVQYFPQRCLPDKAVDLTDLSAAHLAAHHSVPDVKTITADSIQLTDTQYTTVADEDYEAARNVQTRIAELQKLTANHKDDLKVNAAANAGAKSVERLSGVPVSQMGASDIERLKEMNAGLNGHAIGQYATVEAVSRAIRRNHTSCYASNRPFGSFLFVGPSGVSLTELAKLLTQDMLGS